MKRRSPLNPVSSNTLIVFCLTISLSLTLLTGLLRPFRCLLDRCRSFFFKFSHLFGLISNLELRELLLSPKIFSIATTAVTLPVSEFSVAISLALITSSAGLVALIGWVSVDFKSMPVYLLAIPCYRTNYPSHCQNHYPMSHEPASYRAS
jgi:hypothetical protein